MLQRILVVIVLLPIGLALIYLGGWAYSFLIILALGLATREYTCLFRAGGFQPSTAITVGGVILLSAGRAWDGFRSAPWILSLSIMGAMSYHLWAYERGRDQAASDFAITLGGVFYIGWLGAYLISLRGLADGLWWVLTVLPAVWLADSAAYLVGSRIGRHKMTPRLSPRKSWEGYCAGIIAAVIGTALLAALWQRWAGPDNTLTPLSGAILGLLMGVLPTLGDLGESMIKRQVGLKDSGTLLPGHGGAFDRIDSWLWAGVIGYYAITLFFLK
jgi:phosphatidate cytidylyltransferase